LNTEITDLSPLKDLPILATLYASSTGVTNCSVLGDCKTITTLELNGLGLTDISFLSDLPALSTIYLNDNKIKDVSPLSSHPDLSSVYLNRNQIKFLDSITDCPSLKKMELSGNSISNITAWTACPDITTLDLSKNSLSSISVFASWNGKLEHLNLDDNQIRSIASLEEHIRLVQISAVNNEIESLAGLDNCTILNSAIFDGNNITDISALTMTAGSLKTLQLSGNNITNIQALAHSNMLVTLNMNQNRVIDISPLRESVNLEYLGMSGNDISDISALAEFKELRRLNLSNNHIKNISGISSVDPTGLIGLGVQYNFSNNEITDSSPLPVFSMANLGYSVLVLNGNPIQEFSRLRDLRIGSLTFSYADNIDYQPFIDSEIMSKREYYIVDTPLNQQVSIETKLENSSTSVNFVTSASLQTDNIPAQ
jgi:Leucine-rich repeat (LRR) protein